MRSTDKVYVSYFVSPCILKIVYNIHIYLFFNFILNFLKDFVQDVASRGLGLVFTLSDVDGQSDLANSLLDQLIGGKRQVNQVTAETQLFEEGVLGKTPTG